MSQSAQYAYLSEDSLGLLRAAQNVWYSLDCYLANSICFEFGLTCGSTAVQDIDAVVYV